MTLCQYSPCLCEWRVISRLFSGGNSFPLLFHCVSFLIWPAVWSPSRGTMSPAVIHRSTRRSAARTAGSSSGSRNASTSFKRSNQRGFYCSMAHRLGYNISAGITAALTLSGLKRVLGAHFMTHPKQPNTEEEKVPEFT